MKDSRLQQHRRILVAAASVVATLVGTVTGGLVFFDGWDPLALFGWLLAAGGAAFTVRWLRGTATSTQPVRVLALLAMIAAFAGYNRWDPVVDYYTPEMSDFESSVRSLSMVILAAGGILSALSIDLRPRELDERLGLRTSRRPLDLFAHLVVLGMYSTGAIIFASFMAATFDLDRGVTNDAFWLATPVVAACGVGALLWVLRLRVASDFAALLTLVLGFGALLFASITIETMFGWQKNLALALVALHFLLLVGTNLLPAHYDIKQRGLTAHSRRCGPDASRS